MPHLLNVWPRVRSQLAGVDHILLLLDYDGTLAPIAGRPDLAVLPARTREALMAVHKLDRFTLGIVSGRGLADVREMAGIPGLVYAGNHGLEIEGPDGALFTLKPRNCGPTWTSCWKLCETGSLTFRAFMWRGRV